ncbi:Variant surface glycoprotein [Trypanosoma congolense IL3000]|uniref:Variant surface glycoprotein n=1 Tax=Trypanosoma congolense (strain IL3000) TaxID=1068625 RepID=F9WGJ6_TRYCI|nr:Variant surface glycoprotein [Trypanosoma congolense IL3000]
MMKLFMVMMVVMGGWVREWWIKAQAGQTVSENDNDKHFSLLCRIYNVAQHPPIKPVDTKEYQKIVDDIDALSAAANGKERVNTQSEETKSAQTQLTGISRDAKKLLDEIKKINPEGQAEMAKNTFNQVIFGKNGKEDLSHEALEVVPSRMAACGSKPLEKKGQSAGKNLIVDFFCLCAKHDVEDGVDKVCGVSVGRGRESGWGGTKLVSPDTMWNEVKIGCKNVAPHTVTSTQTGHSLYHEFLTKVKAGGNVKVKDSGIVHKRGMLGTAVSENRDSKYNCNGKKTFPPRPSSASGAGVCVFYGNHHREDNIAWLKKFKTGLNIIDKLNTETASWQHQLTTLLNRARELYEKVKADSQIEEENMEEPIAAQHPNPDENENTDSSTQSQRHSLLAWALLLQ